MAEGPTLQVVAEVNGNEPETAGVSQLIANPVPAARRATVAETDALADLTPLEQKKNNRSVKRDRDGAAGEERGRGERRRGAA
jgi:hypothetical protein